MVRSQLFMVISSKNASTTILDGKYSILLLAARVTSTCSWPNGGHEGTVLLISESVSMCILRLRSSIPLRVELRKLRLLKWLRHWLKVLAPIMIYHGHYFKAPLLRTTIEWCWKGSIDTQHYSTFKNVQSAALSVQREPPAVHCFGTSLGVQQISTVILLVSTSHFDVEPARHGACQMARIPLGRGGFLRRPHYPELHGNPLAFTERNSLQSFFHGFQNDSKSL